MTIPAGEMPRSLRRHPDGYWVAPGPAEPVAYPDDGHDALFEVEDASFWFAHRNAVIRAVVARHPPRGPIVDVGGGNGCVARCLEDAGWPVWLVEPGAAGARNAVRRGLEHVICAPLERSGIGRGEIAAAGLFDVLEHIEDDAGFLARLRGFLQPGGRLYLTVPTWQALWSDEDVHAGHQRRYTRAGLTRVLGHAGFAPEFTSYFFWCLPLPILLLRALPYRLGPSRPHSPHAARRAHAPGGAARLAAALLGPEVALVGRRVGVPFGASCIAVART